MSMYDIDALYAQKKRIKGDIKDLESQYKEARKRMEDQLAQTEELIKGCQNILNAHEKATK